MNKEIKELVESLKDRLENINSMLQMPIPDNMHVKVLRDLIPELISEFDFILNEGK